MDDSSGSSVDSPLQGSSSRGLLPGHRALSISPPESASARASVFETDNSCLFTSICESCTINVDRSFEQLGKENRDEEGVPSNAPSTNIENQMGQFGFLGLGDYRAALIEGHCSLEQLDAVFVQARSVVFTNLDGVVLLNPRSDLMFAWQLLNLIFTLLCVFFVPIEVAFATERLSDTNRWLGALLELFFLADIFVNLNLPVQHRGNQRLVSDRRLIWQRYSRSWLIVDLLSCLPLDLVELVLGGRHDLSEAAASSSSGDAALLPRVVSALRLARLFKISKVTRLVRANMIVVQVQDFLQLSAQTVELAKLFFLVLLTVHFMGCGLFVVSNMEASYASWEDENQLVGESISARYWAGVYWAAMTATTIGYGGRCLLRCPALHSKQCNSFFVSVLTMSVCVRQATSCW